MNVSVLPSEAHVQFGDASRIWVDINPRSQEMLDSGVHGWDHFIRLRPGGGFAEGFVVPGSKGTLSDEELWSIVAYLRHLPPTGSQGTPEMYTH